MLRLDPDHTKVALRTCIAMAITFGVCFALEWTAVLGGITVLMLQNRYVGGAADRGWKRLLGALAAAVAAFFCLRVSGQDYGWFIVAMSLWVVLCVFLMQGSRIWYFWIIACAYALVVGFGSIANPAGAFPFAVQTASTVLVGAASVLIVNIVLWPQTAGDAFGRAFDQALDDLRRLVELDGRRVLGNDVDPSACANLRRGLFMSLPKLGELASMATWDSSLFKRDGQKRARSIEQVYDVASLVVDRGEALSACSTSAGAKANHRGSSLFRRNAAEHLRRLEALRAGAVDSPFETSNEALEIPPESDTRDAQMVLAVDATDRRLAGGLEELRGALRSLADTGAGGEDPASPGPPLPPFAVRLRKALIAGVMTACGAIIWRTLDWPGDFRIVVFAAVMGALGAVAPILPARSMMLGSLLGITVGAVPYFLVFPSIDGHFPWFVITFAVFIFPFCYLKDSDRPGTAMLGFLGAWSMLEILDPANAQTVAFSDYAGTSFGVLGGFGLGLFVLWFFNPHVPEHELRSQVQAFFARCERAVRDLESSPAAGPQRASRVAQLRHGLVGILRACGLWTALLSYKHVAANDSKKVTGLMASLHALAFRLECLQRACIDQGSDVFVARAGELARRSREALAEALGTMSVAAQRAERIAALPNVGKEIREVREQLGAEDSGALVLAGHYLAVASEIADCRERYDAIDWAAWDQDRF